MACLGVSVALVAVLELVFGLEVVTLFEIITGFEVVAVLELVFGLEVVAVLELIFGLEVVTLFEVIGGLEAALFALVGFLVEWFSVGSGLRKPSGARVVGRPTGLEL